MLIREIVANISLNTQNVNFNIAVDMYIVMKVHTMHFTLFS